MRNDTEMVALMVAAQGGDKRAYHQLLTSLMPPLQSFIARRINTDSERDDLLQEILISIHKARHTFDASRPLMPWVMAIARFRLMDHLRRHYQQRDMIHASPDIIEETQSDDTPDVTEQTAAREWLKRLLSHMKPRTRTILTRLHIEGYTAKEVGDELGMSESAVKVAAHRALKTIREQERRHDGE